MLQNTSLIHLSLPLQILYVLAHDSLKPMEVCEAFHLCENTSAATLEQSHRDTAHQMLYSLRQTLVSILGKDRRVRKSEAGGSHSNVLRPEAPLSREKKEALRSMKEVRRTGEMERESDTITILQLTDIHLDRMYTEVTLRTEKHSEQSLWWFLFPPGLSLPVQLVLVLPKLVQRNSKFSAHSN